MPRRTRLRGVIEEEDFLRKKLEDELEQISNMKKEVYICSNDTKSDMDNFILVSDRGLFDSIVMLNNVSKNLEEIQKLK
jgi:hypothetical protein